MFTVAQIAAALGKTKTGAGFPAFIQEMKGLGVTYYETFLADGHSNYHGKNSFELDTAPKFEAISISENVNVKQLKIDISDHQQGRSNYFEIIRQCADNGVAKWAVCMTEMTCTYYDKSGNKLLTEQIPDIKNQSTMFTVEHIKAAHSKVKSGADFPAYIQDLKNLGVTYYETFVVDGHTDYYGENSYKTTSPAKYEKKAIAPGTSENEFKADLKAHQDGKTNYPTFCNDAAESGIEKWAVSMGEMTCTYYDKAGNKILVEAIPGVS
jgi:uncharacterized protein YbcV (DUF1398 family)